jgi:hypothetical protein
MLEVIERVYLGRRLKRLVLDGRFGHLIEEQLVRRLEVGPEPLVECVDELGQDDGLVLVPARANFSWPLKRFRFAWRKFDRALADLLQAIKLERNFIFDLVTEAALPARQLQQQEACVCVKLFEVGILVGNDLRQEGV